MSVQPSTKRKIDEVIFALDEAVKPPPERPPPPKRTIVSIYATLAKYGIPTSIKAYPRRTPKAKSKLPAPVKLDSLPLMALYRPSSLPCLLARLETFKLSTFSSKPAPIDGLACALAGWVNEGKERLLCGLCKGSWVVASTKGLKPEPANALVEKQAILLVQEHHDGCPWKIKQCDPSLYSIPLSSPSQLLEEVINIAYLLTPLLEGVDIKYPLSEDQVTTFEKAAKSFLEKEQRRIARLLEKEKETQQMGSGNQASAMQVDGESSNQTTTMQTAMNDIPPPLPSVPALIVALLGWDPVTTSPTTTPSLYRSGSLSRAGSVALSRASSRAGTPLPEANPQRLQIFSRTTFNRSSSVASFMEIDDERNIQPLTPQRSLLRCKMCFRKVPLWNYLPPQQEHHQQVTGDSTVPLSPARNQKSLDTIKEHRHFCAYVTANSSLPSLRNPDPSVDGLSDKLTGWEARFSTALRFGIGDAALLEVYGVRSASSRVDSSNESGSNIANIGTKEVLSYLRELLG